MGITRVASASLLVALVCSAAHPQHRSKISTDAAAADSAGTIQAIVQWNTATGDLTAQKITALGGSVLREFKSMNQGLYMIPAAALSTLEVDPAVKYVSVDRHVKGKLSFTAAAMNAPQVWSQGASGIGVGVAILDSGINQDDNLGIKADKAIAFTDDFTPSAYDKNGHKSKSFGLDWYGHGQHIAGIIASSGKASICGRCSKTMIGISPAASLIDLKVLDSQGEGSDSQVIGAIDEAISLKNIYNIRVMNLSLGRPVFESYTLDPLCQAVEAAWKAGIVVVVAAGNEGRDNSNNSQGYGTILAPGNDPYVITVGSMKTMNTPQRADDLVASYSSKGPTAVDHIVKPDLVAPGNLIVSLLAQHGNLPLTSPQNAVPNAYIQGGAQPSDAPAGGAASTDPSKQPSQVNFGSGYSNNYYTLSGTSMATAAVSGAVADILQVRPGLTPDQVKILLMQTCSKAFPDSSLVVDGQGNTFTDYYDMFTIGAGYVDLQAAINGAGRVPSSGDSLSPVSNYDAGSGNVFISFDQQSAWINQSVWPDKSRWGASAVWSSSVLQGSQAIWSSKSRWGASADTASSSLWSDKSRWGASGDASMSTTESAESLQISGEN